MPKLTEFQTQVLMGFGASVVSGLTVAAILAALEVEAIPAEHSVSIESTSGGRTEPASGFYRFDELTMLTVTAFAFDGYVFKGWYFNGDFVSAEATYTVMIEGQNLLIATFEEVGAPPLIPAYVRPTQNCVAEHWWDVWKEKWEYEDVLRLGSSFYNYGFVKFKICDAAGNGVPDQKIAVYTDLMPDVTDHGFLYVGTTGTLTLATIDNPFILTSLSDGQVNLKCMYQWNEPSSNYKDTIGWGGKVSYRSAITRDWTGPPIWDGDSVPWPFWFESYVRMKHPIYRTLNPIHAYWVDNPSLPVWGDAFADCIIKLKPSHDL